MVATLVAAMLRLFGLGSQSLWIDEVFTWLSAGGMGPFGRAELLENVHGPAFSLAVHAAMRVFGDAEWVLRLPSALAGIALVPALAWMAGRWLGPSAMAPAAWLAAGSPFLVWYSQESRNYSWLMLFATLSAGALLGVRQRASMSRIVAYLVAVAAGLLSNLSFALLAPLHLRWWWSGPEATRGARRRALVVAAAALLAMASPWLPQIASTWDWARLHPTREAAADAPALRGATTFHAAAVPYAFHTFAVGPTLGPSPRELRGGASLATLRPHVAAIAATALTFGALAVLGLRALGRRQRLADTLLWLGVPLLVVCYFALQNFKVFHPRYLAVAMPGVLLVWAAALADLRGRARLVIAVAVAALWALSLQHLYLDPAYRREDYRGALREVRARMTPGEQVVAVGSEEPVVYYGRGLVVRRWWLGHVDRPERMRETWQAVTSEARGSWVVLSRSEDLDPSGRFAAWLESQYPESPPRRFAGVTLWHLAAPAAGSDPAAITP